MLRRQRKGLIAVLGVTTLLFGLPPGTSAHERKEFGQLHLTIGWEAEPVYSGCTNAVDVMVFDASNVPVTDAGGSLSVEVSFGDERNVWPLLPVGGRPGAFRAPLVPTRAGTYTFHITGTLKGQAIDARSTCSDETFDCVIDISEIQFPVKDPSAAQLAERVSRALPRAERAQKFAIAALAISALALAAAIGLGVQRGRQGA